MGNFICVIWKVEHGSAAFVRTPNDRTIIFDAGSSDDFSPAYFLSSQYNYNATNKRIDKLIISHPDRDHISDLPNIRTALYPKILSRNKDIPESAIYASGVSDLKEPLKTYHEMDKWYNTPVTGYNTTEPISNWGNVLVKTFSCKPDHLGEVGQDKLKNNLSITSYVRYMDTEIIFPGDLEPIGWQALFENTVFTKYVGKAKYRIMVASHHGRKSGIYYTVDGKEYCYEKIFEVISPNLVIMSDKRGNETTVPESYRPRVDGGLYVFSTESNKKEVKKVITTKTNNYVLIVLQEDIGTPSISVP